MKKKGLTLVEMLTAIVVLAIVAVIATPLVLDSVGTARRKANYITATTLLHEAENYYAESLIDLAKKENVDNVTNIYNMIDIEGGRPIEGLLYVNNQGKTALSVRMDDICYVKEFYGELEERDDCSLGYVGNDDTIPTITYEITGVIGNNDWYTTFADARVIPSDSESGIDYYIWCTGIDCEPVNVEYQSRTISIHDTLESQVCAIAVDKAGNESDKICSDTVKVDTVKPEISNVGDIVTSINGTINLTATAEDTTSGIESFTTTPSSVSTATEGVYNVVYEAIDKAGNVNTIIRKIIVSNSAPNITFTPDAGAINENGWAKDNFYVTVNATNSNGVKEMYVCSSSNGTCEPSLESKITGSTTKRLVSTEGNSNRICVQIKDNSDELSEVICSTDIYKLDKTAPTAGTIKVNGSSILREWYGTDVTITTNNGSDALSGHLSTTVDKTSITDDTTGTLVTVTTTDKAGNTSTQTYTIRIEKTTPTVIITKSTSNNKILLTATATGSISGYTYEWYKDDVAINGATGNMYETTTPGTYKVKVTTGSGKEVIDSITIHSYNILYNMNGGTGTIANVVKTEDIPITLTATIPVKTNYTFQGWSTDANATTAEYVAGSLFNVNSNTTLYAVWGLSFSGIEDITYTPGSTITYQGVEFLVVSDNGETVTLVTKNNVSTGAYGNNTTFAGSTAYNYVNTTWVNNHAGIANEINKGGIILDSYTNSYVRLLKNTELSSALPNGSGTNFWTLSADGSNMYYGLPNGTNTYTKYETSSNATGTCYSGSSTDLGSISRDYTKNTLSSSTANAKVAPTATTAVTSTDYTLSASGTCNASYASNNRTVTQACHCTGTSCSDTYQCTKTSTFNTTLTTSSTPINSSCTGYNCTRSNTNYRTTSTGYDTTSVCAGSATSVYSRSYREYYYSTPTSTNTYYYSTVYPTSTKTNYYTTSTITSQKAHYSTVSWPIRTYIYYRTTSTPTKTSTYYTTWDTPTKTTTYYSGKWPTKTSILMMTTSRPTKTSILYGTGSTPTSSNIVYETSHSLISFENFYSTKTTSTGYTTYSTTKTTYTGYGTYYRTTYTSTSSTPYSTSSWCSNSTARTTGTYYYSTPTATVCAGSTCNGYNTTYSYATTVKPTSTPYTATCGTQSSTCSSCESCDVEETVYTSTGADASWNRYVVNETNNVMGYRAVITVKKK